MLDLKLFAEQSSHVGGVSSVGRSEVVQAEIVQVEESSVDSSEGDVASLGVDTGEVSDPLYGFFVALPGSSRTAAFYNRS